MPNRASFAWSCDPQDEAGGALCEVTCPARKVSLQTIPPCVFPDTCWSSGPRVRRGLVLTDNVRRCSWVYLSGGCGLWLRADSGSSAGLASR